MYSNVNNEIIIILVQILFFNQNTFLKWHRNISFFQLSSKGKDYTSHIIWNSRLEFYNYDLFLV